MLFFDSMQVLLLLLLHVTPSLRSPLGLLCEPRLALLPGSFDGTLQLARLGQREKELVSERNVVVSPELVEESQTTALRQYSQTRLMQVGIGPGDAQSSRTARCRRRRARKAFPIVSTPGGRGSRWGEG